MAIDKQTLIGFKVALGAVILIVVLVGNFFFSDDEAPAPSDTPDTQVTHDGGIAELFADEHSGEQVQASGVVVKLLPDDNDGSRHQRFLVELDSDITIKIAHNIDLAPRVPCEEGDRVSFYGVYEWSDLGGTVHWTHHDPGGRHIDGWIEHEGERYE